MEMRSSGKISEFGQIGSRSETVLLGRLGCELATIYRDTLHSPLPATLQVVLDRLEEALAYPHDGGQDATDRLRSLREAGSGREP